MALQVFQSATHMADAYYWYSYLQTPTDEGIYLFIHISIYLFIYISINVLSIYLYLSIFIYICISICVVYIYFYLSVFIYIYRPI
jgi:hypothetical protein